MSDRIEKYFDKLLYEYQMALINTWDDSVKKSLQFAIKSLVNIKDEQRQDENYVKSIEYLIREKLGNDFATAVDSKTRVFTEISYKLSSEESQFKGTRISFGPIDARNIELCKAQQVFWLKNHYSGAISDRLQEILQNSVDQKMSSKELGRELRAEFGDMIKQGASYFEGLAEHTGLRVREFGRLTNYKKLGATHYQIVAIIDDRTSDICRALDGKVFPLEPALKSMKAMFTVNDGDYTPDEAKERLKEIAPFIKDSQVDYDATGKPIGIMGNHIGFPPFHWRCRTRTIML